MRSLLFPALSQNIKPGPHDQLDMSHPLNNGLTNCYLFSDGRAGTSASPRVCDYGLWSEDLYTQSGTPTYGPGRYPGGVWKCTDGNLRKDSPTHIYMNGRVFSAVVEVVHTETNNADMFLSSYLGGGQVNVQFYHDGSANQLTLYYRDDLAGFSTHTCSHTRVANKRYQYAVVSTSAGVAMYINGVSQSVTGSHTGTGATGGTGNFCDVSGNAGGFNAIAGWMDSLRVYNARSLSAQEIYALYLDPFAGFVVTDPRAEAFSWPQSANNRRSWATIF